MITAYFRKHKGGHYQYAFFVGGGISGFPANIETAGRIWIDCISHAATQDIKNYVNYDLSKYEEQMNKINWNRLDVKRVIND
jgi:hypothetical protein